MAKSVKILDTLHHWLTDYLPNMEGHAANTIRSYKDSWRIFMQFIANKGIDPSDVTYDMLTYDLIVEFMKSRKWKASTHNNRLAALTEFSKYAENRDFAAHNFRKAMDKIPDKKIKDAKERAYFTQEEVKIFLDLPTPRTPLGYRDHVLLQFMYASGVRADEVCEAKVKDVKYLEDENKVSILIHGKGGKTRRIKIPSGPSQALMKYIKKRGISNQPEAYIFKSQRNDRMSVKCVEDIFSRYIKKAKKEYPNLFKEDSYPPHSMRHTTAVHMLEAKVPLIVVKQFLGHASITTTEIYAKLSPKVVMKMVDDWSTQYWNDFMDEELPDESEKKDDNIPDFLK